MAHAISTEEFQIDGKSVKYFLKELIGVGQFGHVYRAQTISPTQGSELGELAVKWILLQGEAENAADFTEQFKLLMSSSWFQGRIFCHQKWQQSSIWQ